MAMKYVKTQSLPRMNDPILNGALQQIDEELNKIARVFIDWTNETHNLLTTGTLGSGKLTVDSGVGQSIIIKGTSTGNANLGWIGFYDSDGTTRRGHIGDGSVGNDDIYIGADTGYLRLLAAGYISLGTHTYFPDDVVMSFGASLDYSIGYYSTDDEFQIVNGSTLDSNVRLKLDSSGHFDFGAGNLTTTGTIGASTAKLSALTDGYVPYHVADATGLANSPIFIDGTNVGIGTATPSYPLDIAGDINGIFLRIGQTTGNDVNPSMRFSGDSSVGANAHIDLQLDAENRLFNIFAPAASTPTIKAISIDIAGNVVINTGNLSLSSATSTITGGTQLSIEAGATGIVSQTIYDDTTVSAGNVRCSSGAVNYKFERSTSSKKYKDKIKDLELDSSKIYNLRPVSFNSKCEGDDKTRRFIGLIANEIEQIYPEIIDYNENNEAESYDNQMLMTLILAETQRHEARIEALEARFNN